MKKANIVKSNIEFNNIIKSGKIYKNRYYAIYTKEKKEKTYKFGIAVSKTFGSAVIRNKIKRQIKSIIDNSNIKYVYLNYIVVARREILNVEYKEREKYLIELLLNINKEKKDE